MDRGWPSPLSIGRPVGALVHVEIHSGPTRPAAAKHHSQRQPGWGALPPRTAPGWRAPREPDGESRPAAQKRRQRSAAAHRRRVQGSHALLVTRRPDAGVHVDAIRRINVVVEGADGSGPRQLTSIDKDTARVTWSPDGTSAVVASSSNGGVWRIDPSRLNTSETAQPLTAAAAARLFEIYDWSASGTLIGGLVQTANSIGVPAILDLSTDTVRQLPISPTHRAEISMSFLPNSRQVLVTARGELSLIDVDGGNRRALRAVELGDQYRLSRDGKTLLVLRPRFDSDVWLLELKQQ